MEIDEIPSRKRLLQEAKRREKNEVAREKRTEQAKCLKKQKEKTADHKALQLERRKKRPLKIFGKGTGLHLNMKWITNWELSLEMK